MTYSQHLTQKNRGEISKPGKVSLSCHQTVLSISRFVSALANAGNSQGCSPCVQTAAHSLSTRSFHVWPLSLSPGGWRGPFQPSDCLYTTIFKEKKNLHASYSDLNPGFCFKTKGIFSSLCSLLLALTPNFPRVDYKAVMFVSKQSKRRRQSTQGHATF